MIVTSVPQAAFGLAFCEASGPCLLRGDGNDPALQAQALERARHRRRHMFVLYLRDAYPVNVLNRVKAARKCAACSARRPIRSR